MLPKLGCKGLCQWMECMNEFLDLSLFIMWRVRWCSFWRLYNFVFVYTFSSFGKGCEPLRGGMWMLHCVDPKLCQLIVNVQCFGVSCQLLTCVFLKHSVFTICFKWIFCGSCSTKFLPCLSMFSLGSCNTCFSCFSHHKHTHSHSKSIGRARVYFVIFILSTSTHETRYLGLK